MIINIYDSYLKSASDKAVLAGFVPKVPTLLFNNFYDHYMPTVFIKSVITKDNVGISISSL